jgi:hypothetical protein
MKAIESSTKLQIIDKDGNPEQGVITGISIKFEKVKLWRIFPNINVKVVTEVKRNPPVEKYKLRTKDKFWSKIL